MSTVKIPWHHMDSDHVLQENGRQRKWTFKIVKEVAANAEPVVDEVHRAALNEDPFVFGNKPFDSK
jgi:hypothetical protein